MKEMKTLTIGDTTYDIVDDRIGKLNDLDTEAKGCIVDSINEVFTRSKNIDLNGYATEQYVQDYAQPKGNYLTTAPVSSVNGKTGAVTLNASEVGALPDSTVIPSKLSDLTDDTSHRLVTDSEKSAWNAKANTSDIPAKVSDLSNDVGYLTAHQDISGKADKNGLTLGIHTDGLIYLFVDGSPVGVGIELLAGSGDVYGYVDSENNIVLTGTLADGSYSIKYEMTNGSTVDIGDLVLDSNVYYRITNALTNCVNSNNATQIVSGESYSATITANSGYELKSVTATMGGSAVTVTNGVINIASVTGNIVITAVAEEKQAAQPVTVNIGLRDGIRLGSDGGDRTGAAGYCATERVNLTNIPKPCIIHLTKARWAYNTASETGYVMTCAKNASGANLVATYTNDTIGSGYFTVVRNNDIGNDVTVTVTSDAVAEICFSGQWAHVNYSDSNSTLAAANTKATLTYTPN